MVDELASLANGHGTGHRYVTVLTAGFVVKLLPGTVNRGRTCQINQIIVGRQRATTFDIKVLCKPESIERKLRSIFHVYIYCRLQEGNRCHTVIKGDCRGIRRCFAVIDCRKNASPDLRATRNVDFGTVGHRFIICQPDDVHIATIDINLARSFCRTRLKRQNIALIVIRIFVINVFKLNVSGVNSYATAHRRTVRGSVDVLYMRTMGIDRYISTYGTHDGTVYLRNFIARGIRSSVPTPKVLKSIDGYIAVDFIMLGISRLRCKPVARSDNGPVVIHAQRSIGVLVLLGTRNDMQVASDDRFIGKLLGAANLVRPTRANVKRHVAAHLATVGALNGGRCGGVRIVIDQCRVTANVHVCSILAVAARTVAHHATGIQVVAALHGNITADLKISVARNRALIGATDDVVQPAGTDRVNRTRTGDHHMRAFDCLLVAAAIERLIDIDRAILRELGIETVAVELTATSHFDVIERACTSEHAAV